jgi:hypothetical protein
MVQDMSNEHYKIINGERVLMTPEEVAEILDTSSMMPGYIANRTGAPEATNFDNRYPDLAIQLDKLWHDIDSGLFGEQAKTGSFYAAIKSVKDANPKE